MDYTAYYFISANESNPEGELALNILVSNIIEVATAHANELGIGNPSMSELGAGWVLSRLTVEMDHYPKCNTTYRLRTWVEGWNKHFSTRNFCVEDEEGNVYGYARSIWMVLNMNTHENFGLSHLSIPEGCEDPQRPCPIARQGKHPEILPYGESRTEGSGKRQVATVPDTFYTFKYNDIDFYRHVNTVRYLTLLINQFSLDDYDRNFVGRLELSFLHEGAYGMKVAVRRHTEGDVNSFSIVNTADGQPILFSRLTLVARENTK